LIQSASSRGQEGRALGALEDDEVGDEGQGRPAPEGAVAAQPPLVVEGEDDPAANWTRAPTKKATATEIRMPKMIVRALPVLM
jgi:hypothetical protein